MDTLPSKEAGFIPEDKKERPLSPSKSGLPMGVVNILSKILLGIIPIIGSIYVTHVPEYLGFAIYREQYISVIFTLILVSTFLTVPPAKTASRTSLPWYDALLIILSLITGGYVAIFYPEIIPMLGIIAPSRVFLGVIIILLVLEAGRRLMGWPIVIIGIVFILYAAYSWLVPGIFHARNIPWSRVITSLYLSPSALFGIPLAIVTTIVFSFIFFGRILFSVGGGKFLSDFALVLMGRYRGGPAKVAILASCLFGSLSGSPSANVAMTGIVTIPLMKKTGYRPHVAGAIEAVASTGGLLMPPIMGATAFIMAEFLEIPYTKIAIAAFIPAALYYIAVFIQVHLEAVREDHKGLPPEELPSFKEVMRQGWIYLIPAAVLLYCLFALHIQPATSALYGVGATALVSLFRRETRIIIMTQPWRILQDTGKGMLEVGIISGIAGLVIGAVTLTGLGLSLADAFVTISGGNVLILLLLAAVGAIILGMGMPITATYIMLVVLIAPALIQLGLEPLPVHLFVMYFGAMSFLTPPVAVAAYIAASIAGSEPMRTCFKGVRLGIVAYVAPFVFALDPSLLLLGSPEHILLTVTTALLGTVFLSVALEGYLFDDLGLLQRICFAIGALGFLYPKSMGNTIGLVLIIPPLFWELRKKGIFHSNREE